jgi:UDP-GlcNAc3NAcA epimerase
MKILTVVGARPQFVKAAVVSREIAQRRAAGADIIELIIHTGQHFDLNMSDIFFDEISIPRPHHTFSLGGLSHGAMTGRMIEEIEMVVLAERPDWVLVYGDTNSTLAGALAAVKLHVPVAHVESGLRSWNRDMPEEINRVATDHVSRLLFAPTSTAVANLGKEGIATDKIVRTGDVMYDASLYYARIAEGRSLPAGIDAQRPFALATVHRAENTDDPARLAAIANALLKVAKTRQIVFPVHPRTLNALGKFGLHERLAASAVLLPPVGYLDMVTLERAAAVIVTDSGGVQKEAYFFGKPCVTLRNETEWTELVEAGANQLVAPDNVDAMFAAIELAFNKCIDTGNRLYGDGRAAAQIVDSLLKTVR